MIWPFNIIRRRVQAAERDAALADAALEDVRKRWPDVREHASWARERREQNHLTQLFKASLGGHQ